MELISGLPKGKRKLTIYGLFATIALAILFTGFQGFEYINAPFTIADSVYGSTFYFTTGFHGFHVLIGTIFIAVGFGPPRGSLRRGSFPGAKKEKKLEKFRGWGPQGTSFPGP